MKVDHAMLAAASATPWGLCAIALRTQLDAARVHVAAGERVPADLWQTIDALMDRLCELMPEQGELRP